jgi:hypothetical protein
MIVLKNSNAKKFLKLFYGGIEAAGGGWRRL